MVGDVVMMLRCQGGAVHPRRTLLQVDDENGKFDGGVRYEDEESLEIFGGNR